jgi:hypothetical protein
VTDDRSAIPPWAVAAVIICAALLALHGARIDIHVPDFSLSIQLF